MSLKGKRFVAFQEIDNENHINMPVIKAMTGNDIITGRSLYKNQQEFTPQWHLVVCANKLPPVSSDDGGTRRRFVNIPFESKFVENVQQYTHLPNVFQIDYKLKHKLKLYKMPFMKLLLQFYKLYKEQGLPNIEKIQQHTEDYFKQNDVVANWLDDILEPRENGMISKQELLFNRPKNIKSMFRSDREFFEEIQKNIGSIEVHNHQEVWVGYVLRL
jgi:putative DNA primase/helicase